MTVFNNLEFPAFDEVAGIILSGSGAMVTDKLSWSEATIKWLEQFLDSSVPILGVCFGHQQIAQLLGGKVGYNPNGWETGQIQLQLTNAAKKDRLLGKFYTGESSSIDLFATHSQSVIELPKDVLLLGDTNLDSNHCFCYKDHIWGLQFHPEMDKEIMQDYLKGRRSKITEAGLDFESLMNNLDDLKNGSIILQRFKELCFKYSQAN